MTVVSKTVYNNKLDEIVNKYNKTYSKTTEPADLQSGMYTDNNSANNGAKV